MGVGVGVMLDVLRALGEPSRLRIAALLRHGELSVSDLTDILGQSQPRTSRHLKSLSEAGIVDRHREGSWAFYELVAGGPLGAVVGDLLASLDEHDSVIAADLDRLRTVRSRRNATAQEYFAAVAERWDEERSLHADDDVVEATILDAIDAEPYRSLLDLGTGTGRMLQLLAGRGRDLERAIGIDSSHSMLAVARANLERAEIRGVDLRQGDVYSPPLDRDAFDLIVVHQVLHFLDDPARAVREASLLLAPGGRLLVVDLAPHDLDFLRIDHAHRRLGFRTDMVIDWLRRCDLDTVDTRLIEPPASDRRPGVTVSLWLARDRRSPTTNAIGRTDTYKNGGER